MPTYPGVSELVITGPGAPGIESLDDLVSKGVHIRRSSSYFEHLSALNQKRKKEGKAEIPVDEADERLEDYDLLDMVNVGVIPIVIVDSHKAKLWGQIFDKIKVHEDLAINTGGSIAWAMRKDSPKLMKAVNEFLKQHRKGTLTGNILIKRYLGNTKWMDDVLSDKGRERYENTIGIMKRYSDKYDFDWLMIAAQGYQESKLDQSKRSHAGAIGIMQVLPTTAADKNVNIDNIEKAEHNVHAGVKYLRFLRDRYFSDEAIESLDRVLFSFAAYNAGPANISRARKKAASMGFDSNQWFNHVEVAASKTISREPVVYVRNIYKYYVAYKRLEDMRAAREAAVDSSK
jgi:membrane-bound lytic murein transglycosylase MltF